MIHALPYIELLRALIRIPSFSREENGTASLLVDYLEKAGHRTLRVKNNVIAYSRNYEKQAHFPTLLLCSHHDTVRPNQGWTADPFGATLSDDHTLVGLGSNDAGASLVSLLAAFEYCNACVDIPYRLLFAAVAEEEITGKDGIALVLPELGKINFAIVGEPTQMHIATAEKGLLVVDAFVTGQSGHAARNEGINAIYLAVEDILWLQSYSFEKQSATLGKVNVHVTQIQGGYQHNVTPDSCSYTIDIRTNEYYTHVEVLDILSAHLHATLTPRSLRLRSSSTPRNHPIYNIAERLAIPCFGSATISDWCMLGDIPAIKMGPGNSKRSHQPNEFIFTHEISKAIDLYIKIIHHLTIEQL